MKPRTTTNLDVLVTLGSILLTEGVLVLAMWLRQVLPYGRALEPGSEIIPPTLFVSVGVIWFIMLLLFATPRLVREAHLIEGLWRLVAAIGLAALIFAGVLFLSFRATSRLYFIYFVLLDLIVLLIFYGIMRMIVLRNSQHVEVHNRTLIAGTGGAGLRLAHALRNRWNGSVPIVGFLTDDTVMVGAEIDGLPILGTIDQALTTIKQHDVEEIVIALPLESHPRVVNLVRQLQSTPVHIRLVPDFLDFAIMRASVDYVEGLPIVGLRVPAISDEARLTKRVFDIAVSGVLLVTLAPFLLLIALLIRLDSRGSALYRAERVGENGRLFKMYKFRTMVQDADKLWEEITVRREDGKLVFKQPSDPRITRIGRWLRRTSLDELPQLINVLKGDMSLVGPRPELPVVVREEYEPWQWSRFTVPQGMTGWWQINRRGFEHQHLCTADDLYYIQNYSLALDIQILFRTILVVLSRQGSY
jgi:exopolysaccharide biosynthesis polyprenyl glycosylphosphotransferase